MARRRRSINRFGRVVDERGRRVRAAGGPADCVICEQPITGLGFRTRRGYAHRACAEREE